MQENGVTPRKQVLSLLGSEFIAKAKTILSGLSPLEVTTNLVYEKIWTLVAFKEVESLSAHVRSENGRIIEGRIFIGEKEDITQKWLGVECIENCVPSDIRGIPANIPIKHSYLTLESDWHQHRENNSSSEGSTELEITSIRAVTKRPTVTREERDSIKARWGLVAKRGITIIGENKGKFFWSCV